VALVLISPLDPGRAQAAPDDPACSEADRPPAQASLHFMRSSVLCLVNRVRLQYGLRPLHYNPDLRNSADQHSMDMVVNGYFSHDGPGGSTVGDRVGRSGYLARVSTYFIGENIGGGMGRDYGSPLGVFQAWMHSPEHRANILDTGFHDFGAGVALGFPGSGRANTATYTLDLGARR
jgi:uncharacterized protein YkwD